MERNASDGSSTGRAARTVMVVALAAALVGVWSLAQAGQRWSTGQGVAGRSAAGGLASSTPWAVAVAVAGLLAVGSAVVVAAVVRSGPPVPARVASADARTLPARRGRRVVGAVLAVALAVTTVAAGAATARLVRALVDDTTVAEIVPDAAAWLAPAALAVAVLTGGWLLGSWRRWLVPAVLVVAVVVVGMLVGAWPPAVPTGTLTGGAASGRGFRPGHRPPGFGVDALAPLGNAIYGVNGTTVQAIDEQGRWFPLGVLDDLRPTGYGGHVRRLGDDAIDGPDLVGLFERDGQLVVATRRGGVFTAAGGRPGRMLAAVPTDRTPESLAELAALGAVLLPTDALVEGAGPDGRGGILVATTAGMLRLPASGPLEPVPAADALLVGPPTVDGVRVVGRADGSVVLVHQCRVDELVAGAAAFVERARWDDAACGRGPAPVAIAADGQLVMATVDGRMVTGDAIAGEAERVTAAVSVDGAGRFVVAHRQGGRLLRSPRPV